jgi:hypothetical protein
VDSGKGPNPSRKGVLVTFPREVQTPQVLPNQDLIADANQDPLGCGLGRFISTKNGNHLDDSKSSRQLILRWENQIAGAQYHKYCKKEALEEMKSHLSKNLKQRGYNLKAPTPKKPLSYRNSARAQEFIQKYLEKSRLSSPSNSRSESAKNFVLDKLST